MVQSDYIMRMVEQLAGTLGRILNLRQSGRLEEAEAEISNTGKIFFGLDMELIRQMPAEGIIEWLRLSGSFDEEKFIFLADLIKEQGEIYEKKSKPDESHFCYLKSLSLLLDVLIRQASYRTDDYMKKISFLQDKLDGREMPVRIQHQLMQYYELIGDFSQAEDILFHLAETGDIDIYQEGIPFYTRLLAETDDKLLRGKLSRGRVEEGLLFLNRKISS